MPKTPNIGKVTFALVDIKKNRAAVAKLIGDHKLKIPITLKGHLVSQCGGDDGTSIEFEMDVTETSVGKVVTQDCGCIRCKPERFKRAAK